MRKQPSPPIEINVHWRLVNGCHVCIITRPLEVCHMTVTPQRGKYWLAFVVVPGTLGAVDVPVGIPSPVAHDEFCDGPAHNLAGFYRRNKIRRFGISAGGL